jgi:hypothetical protein
METGSKTYKPSIDHIDREALANSNSKSLSLQIGKDFLVLVLYDVKNQKYIGVREYSFNVTQGSFQLEKEIASRLEHDDLQSFATGEVRILFNQAPYSWIPNAFYKAGKEREVLDFQHKTPFSDRIFAMDLPAMDAKLIYGVPDNLVRFFERHFSECSFWHAVYPWVKHSVTRSNNTEQTLLMARVTDSSYDLVQLKNKRLEYVNTFEYTNAEDFLYYLLFTMEQLDLDPEEVALELSGQIVKTSPVFEYVWKYVRNVTFDSGVEKSRRSYIFNEIPAHFYPALTRMHLCE